MYLIKDKEKRCSTSEIITGTSERALDREGAERDREKEEQDSPREKTKAQSRKRKGKTLVDGAT